MRENKKTKKYDIDSMSLIQYLNVSQLSDVNLVYNIVESMQKISGMVLQNDLNVMIELLKVALTQHNTQSQNKVYQYLNQIQQNPQTYYYLTFIFFSPDYEFAIRQIAGLTLKSILSKNKNILSSESLQLVKEALIQNASDSNPKLSTIKDMLISELIHINKGTIIDFQLLLFLIQRISKDAHQPSINTIRVILEDLRFHSQNYEIWANDEFIKFMEILIQVLNQLFSTQYRLDAMKCMNLLIFPLPQNLLSYLHNYVDNVLCNALLSTDREVLLLGMEGLSAVAQTKRNFINKEVIKYLSKMDITDKEIRRVQANLWIQIIDGDEDDTLNDILQLLILKFIKMLEFTQQDYQNLKEDIQTNWYGQSDTQDDQNNQDDHEEQIIKRGGQFTVRKASVICIQKLSLNYSVELWQKSQNMLSQAISSNDWKLKQSAILFIGIVAPQTLEQIQAVLDNLLQFLMQNLKVENAMLAGTIFWSLQKLGQILFSHTMFSGILKVTLNCCAMKNIDSIVVEAGMSLLDEYVSLMKYNLPEKDFEQILILTVQIIHANSSGRKLFSAFRILSQIFQECSALLKDQQCAQIIVMLLNKWDTSSTDDNVLCPLIECLVTVAQKKPTIFTKYAHDTFLRSVSCFHLHNTRKALVLRSIDLTSSILSLKISSISAQIQKHPQILTNCVDLLKSQHLEIKNFSYSLISQLVCQYPNINIYQLIQTVAATIDKNHLTSVNNGLMCLTDIISISGQIGQQFTMEILQMAIFHLAKPNLEKIFAMNMAKIVGRICLYSKDINECFERIKPIWKNLCLGFRTQENNTNSDLAFQGLFKVCFHKLNVIQYDLDLVIQCFTNYPNKNHEIAKMFNQMLHAFRNLMNSQQWEEFLNRPIFLPGIVRKIQNILSKSE